MARSKPFFSFRLKYIRSISASLLLKDKFEGGKGGLKHTDTDSFILKIS